ncbi:hypothetical protein L6452_41328 [Arctium lappa]|uniref:Uncharacterized protein n=1 Tax=Arctium lappa TaxID=4217 RepID=A0ACB8XP08_ARCLA|nr:hypothetical protein L6452_41328 [Arctium lappa]
MFGEVEDQPKKTKKEYISQSGLKIVPSAQSQVCPSDQHHQPGWCQSHISQEYEGVLTSSGAEDLSGLRQPMISSLLREPKIFQVFGSYA